MNSRGIRLVTAPASFGFIAAFVMWIVTAAYSGFGNVGAMLSAALAFGAFSVLIGTGQMLVIASGPGNIDLSVPWVLTLAAYVSMTVMHEQNYLCLPGLCVALVLVAVPCALHFTSLR